MFQSPESDRSHINISARSWAGAAILLKSENLFVSLNWENQINAEM
jgi:hypothetical protein